jgi:hypothetical protein
MVNWPSAPIFQLLDRYPIDRPTAISTSGVALTTELLTRPALRQRLDEINVEPLKGSTPDSAKRTKVVTTVRATAMSGDSTAILEEGWARRTRSSRMGLRRSLRGMALVHPAHQQADLLSRQTFGRIDRREPAGREHGYPIGNFENLV